MVITGHVIALAAQEAGRVFIYSDIVIGAGQEKGLGIRVEPANLSCLPMCTHYFFNIGSILKETKHTCQIQPTDLDFITSMQSKPMSIFGISLPVTLIIQFPDSVAVILQPPKTCLTFFFPLFSPWNPSVGTFCLQIPFVR